ncbi:hypothetical protein IAU60_002695 [Kwoniella sp. DSM 27419]
MPAIGRAPPGHPQGHAFDEFDAFSRSSSQSPPDNDELWADPDDLLAMPAYDASLESSADPLFPSPHKFNIMVQEYLRNLSPKKREKALLTQRMYDAVLAVLQDPKDTSTKTAQFRFWAKKMFQLTSFGGEKVVCHDHKPVAVKEQIYEVLCHCHGQAGHGGRDKTSAQVRRYYSWIPKEIIARFVRDCPFCQSRRTQSSAGFSNMSESQAFLISLQTSDTQLASKRPVSLAAARANAAALGHKPYRRPSIRTLDLCRSRRGSAVSDDGYLQYIESQYPAGMSGGMDMDPSLSSHSSVYDADNGTLFVPGFEFGTCPNPTAGQPYSQIQPEEHQVLQGPGQLPIGSYPPMPRRASSYHEQLHLGVQPAAEAMLRRNSESNIDMAGASQSGMLFSNPASTLTDASGGNQFLLVPGTSSLSRNTSSSSLTSFGDEPSCDYRYFSQEVQVDPLVTDDSKLNEYRANSYSASGSVTPLEGNFPLSVQMQGNIDINLFSTDYFQGIPGGTYTMPIAADYQFPSFDHLAVAPDDKSGMLPDWMADHRQAGEVHVGADGTKVEAEATAAVQRMLDSNNIFAIGEAAGMSQDQVVDLHDADPGMLDLTDLRSQMEALDTSSQLSQAQGVDGRSSRPHEAAQARVTSDPATAELEAMLGFAVQNPESSTMDPSLTDGSSLDYTLDEEALKQMEQALAQAEELTSSTSISGPGPTVIIDQPVEDSLSMFVYTAEDRSCGMAACHLPDGITRPTSELDLSNWAGFAMS